jgi:hypothetical protein
MFFGKRFQQPNQNIHDSVVCATDGAKGEQIFIQM